MSASQQLPIRLAYRVREAADALGVSDDWFVENVLPEVRVVRRGRVKLIPHSELSRWLDANASYALAA